MLKNNVEININKLNFIFFSLKKTRVQIKLKNNCIKNKTIGKQNGEHNLLDQAIIKEININTYSIGQTTPKTQLGGFNFDLFNLSYHL